MSGVCACERLCLRVCCGADRVYCVSCVCVDQDLRMSAERLCHYRVQCWKQHIGPSIVDTCLDFCVVKHAENIKMHVELSFATHHDCQSVLDETTKTVQILVKDPICIGIARLFQQAQPGEGTEGS